MKAATLDTAKIPMLDRFCRNALFNKLADLHTGYIQVNEGDFRYEFGNKNHTDLAVEINILDYEAYRCIALSGSTGAGESYMTGDWTVSDLPKMIRILSLNKDVLDNIDGGLSNLGKIALKWFHESNRNTEKGSRRNIAAHYDLGNEMFELFLDPTLMYSSGIFPHENASMEEASINKLDRICRKLDLTPDDHLVEIGTGWGSMAIYAAKNFGCKVTTTTISEEQYAYAKQRIQQEGLENQITLLKQDYRALEGQFDKLVSIEMIEAVGWQYLDTYTATISRLLKEDGIALIQAITIDDWRYEQAKNNVDFIKRYIFPGSFIPCVTAIQQAMTKTGDMKMTHLEDITPHYAKTLAAWRKGFLANQEQIKQLGYSDDFIRLWDFYFAYCEGGFAERVIGDVQVMFAKPLNRREPILPSLQ